MSESVKSGVSSGARPSTPSNNKTSGSGGGNGKNKKVYFTGHHAYIITIAKLCKDSGRFTDVVIECSDGIIRAHRIVLASSSPFLSQTFKDLPQGLNEYTIIIPNIKKAIVEILVDFLYTGQMTLARSNTWDLQQLVQILQIDPDNVRIDTENEEKDQRIAKSLLGTESSESSSVGKSGTSSSIIGNKRRLSSTKDDSDIPSKESKNSSSSNVRGQPRTRGRCRPIRGGGGGGNGKIRNNSSSEKSINATITASSSSTLNEPKSNSENAGFHDMTNVETWVCAICQQYDPPISISASASSDNKATTEWIGCDCDRWYHQYCTKLKVVDETFSCAKVKLKCLPPTT